MTSRTYVVIRWSPEMDAPIPLGTVSARTRTAARAEARTSWPDVQGRALRVHAASAVSTAVLLNALAEDGTALLDRAS